MTTEITMPKLTDTMEEGKILRWLVKEGDYLGKGDIIAEIETDKADMELESFVSGILEKIVVLEGETVPAGTVIAIVNEGITKGKGKVKPEEKPEQKIKPREDTIEVSTGEPCCVISGEEELGEEKKEVPIGKEIREEKKETTERIGISPAAKRLAEEKGVDLKGIKGSGPEGRILIKDIEDHLLAFREKEVKIEMGKVTELSKMRKAIAKKVIESKQEIPHFYVTIETDMTEAVKTVESLNSMVDKEEKITINDLIIKAVGTALERYRQLNSTYVAEGILMAEEINIGIIVGLDEGMLIPVLKGCNKMSLREISAHVKRLKDNIKAGKLGSEDLSGGTFTVSNMGMFEVENFAAIIYPPQAGILAISSIKEKPVVKEGKIFAAKMMKATLSADHRIIDGVIAAKFLQEFNKLLENPITLII